MHPPWDRPRAPGRVTSYSAVGSDKGPPPSSAAREFRGFRVTGSLDWIGAWGLWITTSNEGVPILVQIPLGRRHFIVDERAKGADGFEA
jgi:hypothetical protein